MERQLKVLILTTSFPIKNVTDGGHFVKSECDRLIQNNMKIHVVAPAHPKSHGYRIEDDIEISRFRYFIPSLQKIAYGAGIPSNLKRSVLAWTQLPFFFISFLFTAFKYNRNADIIHCHWFPSAIIGLIVIKKRKQKMVLTMHHPHRSNFIFKWILRNTDFLFCNSTYTQNVTNEIIKVENQAVLHLGIDTSIFKSAEKKKDPSEQFIVLFVGRLIEWKGTKYLIKAFAGFVRENNDSNAKLFIVGYGPLKKELEQLTVDLSIENQVQFEGYVPREKVVEYFQRCHVFSIPSIKLADGSTEGLGLTAIEACACELPVIASRTGGIVDIIEDGKNGYLVEPGNDNEILMKLSLLYKNVDLAKSMGQVGRQRILEKFDLDKNAEIISRTYHKLAYGPKS